MSDFLAEAARRWPGRAALSGRTRRWSFAEFDTWVSELAERHHGSGPVPRGRILPLVAEATPEGIAALLAGMRAGYTVAPLNPRLTETESRRARQALDGPGDPEGMAVLWTSGTSGVPRGVVLTPDNLRASAGAAAERLALGPDDRWLASLSVAHVGGLALVTRALLLGSELVAYGSFDPGEASLLVDEGWITHASLVPTQLLRVLDHRDGTPPPPSFRCVLVGGAHAPAALVARALDSGWPVALTYGMTEMSSQVATAPPDLVARKPGSVGAPLDGTEVRVDAQGEILARGPTQARGFLGGGPPLADGEGWYHTGDLGAMDAEGHLHVTGRRSIRVVSGGVTVDPAEVEEVIRSHPAVRDVCVVGLPDPEWGERLVAVVVPVEGEFDEVEVDAFVRERLSPPKRPRSWRPVDDLPLNANGKVDRDRARSLVLEQPGHSGGPPME